MFGSGAIQQIVERGIAGALRMHALDRLAKLHLVAQQHDIAAAYAGGDEVGESNPAGLVDKKRVETCNAKRLSIDLHDPRRDVFAGEPSVS